MQTVYLSIKKYEIKVREYSIDEMPSDMFTA